MAHHRAPQLTRFLRIPLMSAEKGGEVGRRDTFAEFGAHLPFLGRTVNGKLAGLRQMDLLAGVGSRGLQRLASNLDIAGVGPGFVLIRHGRVNDTLWILLEGTAARSIRGREIGSLGPYSLIGAPSMIYGEPAIATLTALEPIRALVAGRAQFQVISNIDSVAFGLKAATVTPEGAGDVGSPNRLLREEVDGKVIVRTGRRLPGVATVGGVHHPISIVRMAVDDAYGAEEWREGSGDDEVACRTERITRGVCRAVAEFAFAHARRTRAKVFGGPKYTVSPVYEGMLKEEMDAAAARYPDVPYEPQLIDATYALLISSAGDALVIPSLNRDGDCLSALVMHLFGSIAGAESTLMSFTSDDKPDVVMTEAPHGTAPRLFGKNVANPMAMILAVAALLTFVKDRKAPDASRAIYESVRETVREGSAPSDLGGHTTTTGFTDAVFLKVKTKHGVWASW